MPTIEQVSKRLFSDRNWLKKCAIGLLLSVFPVVNFVALGYVYRIFRAGKRGEEFSLPEWDDLKGLFLDGLRLLVIGLVFAALPIGLVVLTTFRLEDALLARLPLMPVAFMAGPLTCAALYLYLVKEEIADCFNLEALGILIRNGAMQYAGPTFAFIGLCMLSHPLYPVAFLGCLYYAFVMAGIFRDLERRAART